MKREALQPAQHLPCPTHPSDTAGHGWLKNMTSFIPKFLKLECKSLIEASRKYFRKKIYFMELHRQLRAGIAANTRKEHLPLGEPGRSRGVSCALSKWWMMLLITRELPVKILKIC